ncbi:hypothetical protein chiPu_0000180 [Chiloscyllium punctatum]|uniref:C2H2-type domain-containing protein n=1 Tax=Chiloscyllium punctatum TaxID=137246 RepID=A0A401RSA9_CHIPU|nr:hypothetical protein [Chiloscyllium punctatum]
MIQDYAGKEKAIAKALEDLKANFYCELCDKQYHKHQEFDNHINSYDHAHKQRLKELKQREFARNVASRSRKDEKKQEKALKRLHQLAELRKQTECAPGSGPMFKPATVAIDNHSKRVAAGSNAKDRETGRKSNSRASFKKEALKKNLENSLQSTAQVQSQLGLKPFTNKSNSCIPIHKGSVSFSFSKKAPVKLESSASVFNDTTEEKQCEDEPQNYKVKAEPTMLGLPGGQNSMACTKNNEQMKQSQMDSGIGSNPFARVKKLKALMLKENKDEEGKEYYCYTPTLCNTKTKFPFLLFMKSSETTDADKVSAHNEKNKGFHADGSSFKCSVISEIGDGQHEVRDTKKIAAPQLNYLACQRATNQEDGKTLDQDISKMKNEALSMFNEKQREPALLPKEKLSRLEPSHRPKPITGPFLPVLSRDESTILQWPSELLLFTQTEPSISYSCNPLYFDFKLSRNKNRENGTTESGSNMDHQRNMTVAIEGDNGTAITEAHNISVEIEKDLNQRRLIGTHKSKERKHHHKTSKRSKQKPENGYAENVIKKTKGMKYKHNLKEKDKYALEIKDPESQNTEEYLKEEKYSKLTPKRFLHDGHSSTNEELEQISSSVNKKPLVSPLDLSNKKQKVSPDNSLSSSIEMCENQKVHKARHDSLNLNSNETNSINELPRESRKSSSHCSYEDGSESNRRNEVAAEAEAEKTPTGLIHAQKADFMAEAEIPAIADITAEVEADLKLNDPTQCNDSPRPPPSVDNMTLLSVIGKLATTEKVVVKNDDTCKGVSIDKANEPENSKWTENETALTINQEQSILQKEVHGDKTDIEEGSMDSIIKNAEADRVGPTVYEVQPAEENVTPVPEKMSSVVSCVTDGFDNSSMVVKEEHSQTSFYDSSDISSDPMGEVTFDYYNTNSESVDKMDPTFMETAKSASTSLASQPIIFTSEEMEKYSKLQLQAQQHIQQQFLAKQVKTFPSSASLAFSPVPAFQPVSIQQPSAAAATVTTVHHTLLQHHAAATLTAALHPNAHQQAMAQLHHITQPHITPFTFSPIAPSIFPAHPTTFLAGHPLHFIPAAAIHPAQLALHPLPHTTLCPTLLAPHPVAAAAAASAIHFHPLLHPLFPGHDLQHRSAPNT